MKRSLLSLVISIVACWAMAQSTFVQDYATGNPLDRAFDIATTAEGGYAIICAHAGLNNGGYLLFTDSMGNFSSGMAYSTTWPGFAELIALKNTPDGGYIIGGGMEDSLANWVGLVIKTDDQGNIQWSKAFDNIGFTSISVTQDSGYICAGGRVIRLNSLGDTLWTADAGMTAWDVIEMSDGSFTAVGEKSTVGAICNISSTGVVNWVNMFTGNNSDYRIDVVQEMPNGNVLVSFFGNFTVSLTPESVLMMLTPLGDTIWTQGYDILGKGLELTALNRNSGNSIILSGGTIDSTTWVDKLALIKTDSLGAVQWANELGVDGSYADEPMVFTSQGTMISASSGTVGPVAFDSDGKNSCTTSLTILPFNPVIFYNSTTIPSQSAIPVGTINLVEQPLPFSPITTCSTIGVDEKIDEPAAINVFPNPTAGLLQISNLAYPQAGTKKGMMYVEVLDVMGRAVLSTTEPTIDLGPYPSGLYFVRVETESGTVTRKVVKQ